MSGEVNRNTMNADASPDDASQDHRERAITELGFGMTEAAMRHYLESCEFDYTKRTPTVSQTAQLAEQFGSIVATVETLRHELAKMRSDVDAALSLMQTLGTGTNRIADAHEKQIKELGLMFGWIDQRLAIVEKKVGVPVPPVRPKL